MSLKHELVNLNDNSEVYMNHDFENVVVTSLSVLNMAGHSPRAYLSHCNTTQKLL